jgi:hypothetical protein
VDRHYGIATLAHALCRIRFRLFALEKTVEILPFNYIRRRHYDTFLTRCPAQFVRPTSVVTSIDVTMHSNGRRPPGHVLTR